MPKMKSHRGAAKRFRTTGSGRLRRRHNFRNHLLVHKSRKRKRHLRGSEVLERRDERHLKKALPYGLPK